eukprot:gnl/Spiro4/20816_TR10133_c0_g1_i1.p1 gnl/Spiro4/20816_TR10133_c0_g1~~gnl/Spiro4/20816_TR10133_c0_g1_i1.p1  ORF type:complete len:242 (+),score=25.18 gnl/Spiro4/20816_TR10133_c0_g1_i1:33-728(+)
MSSLVWRSRNVPQTASWSITLSPIIVDDGISGFNVLLDNTGMESRTISKVRFPLTVNEIAHLTDALECLAPRVCQVNSWLSVTLEDVSSGPNPHPHGDAATHATDSSADAATHAAADTHTSAPTTTPTPPPTKGKAGRGGGRSVPPPLPLWLLSFHIISCAGGGGADSTSLPVETTFSHLLSDFMNSSVAPRALVSLRTIFKQAVAVAANYRKPTDDAPHPTTACGDNSSC